MAAHAVVHDDVRTAAARADRLRLGTESENRGVIKAVHGLETIGVYQVVVRDVAVVAGGPGRVGRVIPRLVIGRHDVAVDAGRRIVREVGMGTRHVDGISPQTRQNTTYNKDRQDHRIGQQG